MSSIDLSRGQTPEQIHDLILGAYAERGWAPPGDLEPLSRIVSASTARRASGFRVAVELGKLIRSTVVTLRSDDPREEDRGR